MVRSSMDSFLLFSFKPSQFKEPKHAPCRKLSSFVYSRAHGSTSCPTNKISHPTHSSISSSLFLPILLPPTKVGDNPASDMAMAAFGGPRWRGVLVCSGVYSETDATCGAVHVAPSVSGAVDYILQTARKEEAAAAAGVETACANAACKCSGCTCGETCTCGTPASKGVPGCDPCKDFVAANVGAAGAKSS